ncbi:MAG: FkbM family methyltransferase [Candidatus Micrarchaeota archaeon]|nr:FkbM family methyltransferase [Candidatus Micrarchaeota archaeon]
MAENIRFTDHLVSFALPIFDLIEFSSVVSNWYEIPLIRLGLKKNTVLRIKNGKQFEIKNSNDYMNFYRSFEFQKQVWERKGYPPMEVVGKYLNLKYHDRTLHFLYSPNDKNDILLPLLNQFLMGEYSFLKVKGKIVVDIGASIGDTAVYFAVNGAKHVYSFEPFRHPYAIAKQNITANNLSSKITLLNEGAGYSGSVKMNSDAINIIDARIKATKNGTKIKMNSLEGIVKKYNLKDALLKVDCEGYEYDLILLAKPNTLKKFNQIVIEYHHGYINLEEKLKQSGFKVWHTPPKFMRNPHGSDAARLVGLIYAERN